AHADKIAADKIAADKAIADKAAADKAKAAADKAAADKIAADKAHADKIAADKIAADKAIADKAAADKAKAAADKAAADKIAADKATADKLSKDKSDKEKAVIDKLFTDKASAKAKQFKTTSDLLTQQANIIWQFKVAQATKKVLLVKKLTPQVNKLKKDLVTVPVNIKNTQGQTPLMLDPRRAAIVYGLEKKKAKITVNAKDSKGKSVLQYLIASPFANNINLYRALINAGAKVNNNDIKVVQNKLKTKPKQLKPIVAILQQGKKKNK
ncbi:MAG: hypothetical protein P4L22_00525, partial [Candidatus Babeliales bacterium]|nr:hypothetical protein [Candidatus Babeliales bacterium]